jgi:adenine phosphoribosyltransferase
MGEEANCNVAMESAAPKENGHTTGGAAAEAKAAAAAWAEIAVTDAAAVPKPTPPPAAVAVDPRLQGISDAIRVVPHFPKQGPTLPSRFASLPYVQIPSGI